MLYISKGILTNRFDERCSVFRSGTEILLTKCESELWLAGRDRLSESDSILTLEDMENAGLVSIAEDSSEESIYKLMSECMFIPLKEPSVYQPMTPSESTLYVWLREAGIRLTTAELICLCEKGIAPAEDLLGENGRLELISTIYLDNDINEFTLENHMEAVECRNWVIAGLLSLVQKNYVFIG